MPAPRRVRIVEVGPRDGLQNEPAGLPTEAKVRFVEQLADAGLEIIEAGSFVSPERVPQMADTAEVLARIRRKAGVVYSALVPNLRGLESALGAGADEVAVFAAASETFSIRNGGASVVDTLERIRRVCEAAAARGVRVRGYVSTVFGCPFEGDVPIARVVEVVSRLADLGCYEISLGDSTGIGTPDRAAELIELATASVPADRLAVHFHDTGGRALANIRAALPLGVATVDASAGGLGGCPFAPGAPGNVATEDVVHLLHEMGIETGVDPDAVADAAREIRAAIKPAGPFPGPAAGSGGRPGPTRRR